MTEPAHSKQEIWCPCRTGELAARLIPYSVEQRLIKHISHSAPAHIVLRAGEKRSIKAAENLGQGRRGSCLPS